MATTGVSSLAPLRSFPIIYATSVLKTAAFYALLGFDETVRLPDEDEPGYLAMARHGSEIAIVDAGWPRDRYGMEVGTQPRFELFAYVADVRAMFTAMKAVGVTIISEPDVMPWGETVGFVTDPDGNPVALAQAG